MPFIAGAGWLTAVQSCLLLGAANLVYYLRARTEERHLSADPVIARHGLFARVAGVIGLARAKLAQ